MKFYVAGPAMERLECLAVINTVLAHGHEITFNWALLKDAGGDGEVRESWRDDTEAARIHALKEKAGVMACDVLVFWLPSMHWSGRLAGKGCFWEAGMAAGDDEKEVWLLNDESHKADLVFYHLPNVRFLDTPTFDLSLRLIKAWEDSDYTYETRSVAVDRIIAEATHDTH